MAAQPIKLIEGMELIGLDGTKYVVEKSIIPTGSPIIQGQSVKEVLFLLDIWQIICSFVDKPLALPYVCKTWFEFSKVDKRIKTLVYKQILWNGREQSINRQIDCRELMICQVRKCKPTCHRFHHIRDCHIKDCDEQTCQWFHKNREDCFTDYLHSIDKAMSKDCSASSPAGYCRRFHKTDCLSFWSTGACDHMDLCTYDHIKKHRSVHHAERHIGR
jgi:hypothetical protein